MYAQTDCSNYGKQNESNWQYTGGEMMNNQAQKVDADQ
jgi:hypothetical protein